MRLAHVKRVVHQVVVDGDAPHTLLPWLAAVEDRLSEVGVPPQHLCAGEECVFGTGITSSWASRSTPQSAKHAMMARRGRPHLAGSWRDTAVASIIMGEACTGLVSEARQSTVMRRWSNQDRCVHEQAPLHKQSQECVTFKFTRWHSISRPHASWVCMCSSNLERRKGAQRRSAHVDADQHIRTHSQSGLSMPRGAASSARRICTLRSLATQLGTP